MCNFARLFPACVRERMMHVACVCVECRLFYVVSMRKKLSYFVLVAAVFAGIWGCSSIQQAINTGDADIVYDQGLLYYNAGKWNKAIILFETCEPYFRGTSREDSLAFYKARCYFKNRDYANSSALFDEFRRTYGRSAFIEDAEAMYAISLYNMCPAPERDQSTTQQAIMAISEFISHHPQSEQMPIFDEMTKDLTWRLHEKSYLNAYTYYKIERYRSAIMAFRNALKQYPTSHRREDVMYYIVMSCHKYAENSIDSKQMDRYLETLDAYYTFVMEFPESKYSKDVERVAESTKRFIDKNNEEE